MNLQKQKACNETSIGFNKLDKIQTGLCCYPAWFLANSQGWFLETPELFSVPDSAASPVIWTAALGPGMLKGIQSTPGLLGSGLSQGQGPHSFYKTKNLKALGYLDIGRDLGTSGASSAA